MARWLIPRVRDGRALLLIPVLALFCLSLSAQQKPINPRAIPPPPPEEPKPQPQPTTPAPPPPARQPAPARNAAPPPNLPSTVEIPGGTRLGVVLDTPLSTRIAKQGQVVRFHTEDSFRLSDALELPPETEFTGTVIEAKRPGSFGKPGVLRVRLDTINLVNGTSANITAHLDSPDMKSNGRMTSDSKKSADLYSLVTWTLEGTLIGAGIHGGKGAAVGAGAGALIAILIARSKKGGDLYLEPGMPFTVIIDDPVRLSGPRVYDAQQEYAAAHPNTYGYGGSRDTRDTENDPDRPKLKHRPHNPNP